MARHSGETQPDHTTGWWFCPTFMGTQQWFMTFFYPHDQRLQFPGFFGLPKIREVFAVPGTTGDSVSCQEGSWLH